MRKRLKYIFSNYKKKVTLAEYMYEIDYNHFPKANPRSENIPRSVFNRIRIKDKKNLQINKDYQQFKRKRRMVLR